MSKYLDRVAETSDRIAQAMKDSGKKQVDIVRETGLNKSIISRCLSGKTEPKSGTIMLLARALDVSEMWLWGYDVPKDRAPWQKKNDELSIIVSQMRESDDFYNMVHKLAQLNDAQRASIEQLLNAFFPDK